MIPPHRCCIDMPFYRTAVPYLVVEELCSLRRSGPVREKAAFRYGGNIALRCGCTRGGVSMEKTTATTKKKRARFKVHVGDMEGGYIERQKPPPARKHANLESNGQGYCAS